MSNGINAPYGLSIVQSQIGNGGTQKLGKYNIYTKSDGTGTYADSLFKGDIVYMQQVDATKKASEILLAPEIYKTGTIATGVIPKAGNAGTIIATGVPVGIFMGCQFTDATSGLRVNSDSWIGGLTVKAGTDIVAFVNDDPEVVFKVQISTPTNGEKIALQGANSLPYIYQKIFNGQNAKIQVGGVKITELPPTGEVKQNPASGANGKSAQYLDGSTIAFPAIDGPTTADLAFPIKIIGLVPEIETQANPTGLVQGVNMPFIDVLCKFNQHLYRAGTNSAISGLTAEG